MATQSLDLELSSSQYATASDSTSLSITASITVMMWVKPESFGGGGPWVVASKVNGSINGGGWLMNFEDVGAGVICLGFQINGGGTITSRGTTDFAGLTATWTAIAATWTAGSGNASKLYVNGSEQSYSQQDTGQTSITDTNTDTYIGAQNNSGTPIRFYDGKVCQVVIYNADKSASIASLYNTIVDAGPNVAASWQFNGNTQDGSGFLNTMTLQNAPSYSADVPTLAAQATDTSIDLELSSSQYMSRNDTASTSITGNITLETWVKWETLPGTVGTDARLINKFHSQPAGQRGNYELEVTTANKLDMIYSADGTYDGGQYTERRQDTASMTSTGVWYHCKGTATVATQTITLYIDGSVVASSNIATGATAIGDQDYEISVGARNENGTYAGFVDGKMWLARIWSEVHSADDKCTIFASGTSNLAAQWILNTSYLDTSGNNNTQRAFNAPVFTSDIPSTCGSAGPANLKSLDTNVKANIKSYNTNVLANIKSINTNA